MQTKTTDDKDNKTTNERGRFKQVRDDKECECLHLFSSVQIKTYDAYINFTALWDKHKST